MPTSDSSWLRNCSADKQRRSDEIGGDLQAAALLGLGKRLRRNRTVIEELAANLLKVRDRQGRLRSLEANAAQRLFEQRCGRQNIVLKARQMGMTTWVAARFFLRTITTPGVLTVMVAQNQQAAESIFRIVQRMWENLPTDMREGPLKRSRANVGQMVFPRLDSEFRVWSAADPNAGRGMSICNLHCSEVSRWPGDAAATLAGLRAALTPDGEMVMESTPNGAYGAFYDEWRRGIDAAGAEVQLTHPVTRDGWTTLDRSGVVVRHFLPWWMEPAYVGAPVAANERTEEECALVAAHGLSAEQVGYRRGLERNFSALRSQEFAEDAETCFRAAGDCCFDVDALERRLGQLAEPLEWRSNGTLAVWLPALAGRNYVVAVDTAGGGADGDFAAVQVIDAATGAQCAELQARLAPLELASVAAHLAREYSGAMLAVERNNHGSAVLAYLATVERYGRVYEQNGQAGWLTTSVSKPQMISALGALLVEQPELFVSRRLLNECRTFVRGEYGRSGAANGAHDDLVMSMALAQMVRRSQELGDRGRQ